MGMNVQSTIAQTNKSLFNKVYNWFLKEYFVNVLDKVRHNSDEYTTLVRKYKVQCICCKETLGSLFPIIQKKIPGHQPSGTVNMFRIPLIIDYRPPSPRMVFNTIPSYQYFQARQ